MNIGKINSVPEPEGNIPARPAPIQIQGHQSVFGLSLKDLYKMPVQAPANESKESSAAPAVEEAAAPAAPAVPQKSKAELRESFRKQLSRLKDQSGGDKAALVDLAKLVDGRSDLTSQEKEWLFANEVVAYTANAAMEITSPEKKGQPWTPNQQQRFDTVTSTFKAANELVTALSVPIDKADSGKPVPANPLVQAYKTEVETLPPGHALPANSPPLNAPVANNAPKKDPLVELWEMRRQEAQDVFNDYRNLMQKINESRARIQASRSAFFWKIYSMHYAFLSESWRR